MSFVHLHVHTQYSLLDGFSDPNKLTARAKEMGMPAVAITDHGTMFGVIEFYNAALANGVKPIIGLEAYMAARGMKDKDSRLDKQSHHLLLLAQNQTGYQNLLKIASAAQLEGFYYYPRIDHEFLAAHSQGLICSTGCMSSEVPRALRDKGPEEARKLLDFYYDVFGADNFYFELQDHQIPELREMNKALLQLGKRYNASYIATNDVHYIQPEDARLQDILLCIQTGNLLTEPNRFKMSVDSFYLRSPEEMGRLFAETPEALSNTLLIAERCNVDLAPKGYHLPRFPVPDGFTAESYLRHLCEAGLKRRYGERAELAEVRQRLEYELGVIHQMGFDAYFLIVWDLCREASRRGIWYNARGSAAGSMVAYTLDITLIEPLHHGLIFERFLNPGRISMPDIDMDFQDDRRSELMEYTTQKYGSDRVAQIITFGTLGARAAIRDVGRVMDIPLAEVDRISKMVPNIPGKPVSLVEALENVSEFKKVYDEQGFLHELIDTASKMEGVVRNAGTHAAGVVISDEPVVSYIPLHRPTGNADDNSPIKTVTQFEMSIIEALGLLKVDFLGLATLTIMQRACDLIEARHGMKFNLDNIPIDDPETFEFLSQGHTAGVFQLEGAGMTRFLVQMRPRNLDNVIAMVALYRPGPLEFIPAYIRRMHGEEPIEYRHPQMEPIFQETFGIPVYQEQIMRAAINMAGYTASDADELRKSIAKKKADVLQKHRLKFIAGAQKAGIPEGTATAIFEDWENFARYGFPKAHAADYGVIAVETAYLKTHYTVEYMTALLSASKNDSAKVALYAADCRSMGISVLPPDVNASGYDFTIEDLEDGKGAIRFGLGAVKNVGQGPVDLIIQAREKDGPFGTLNDFASRVDLRAVGKRPMECLIKVGALDSFGARRSLLEVLDQVLSVSASHFRAAQSGQLSFFGSVAGVEDAIELPYTPGMDTREQLEWERELIGLYVSDHPLSPYLPYLRRKVSHFSGQLHEVRNRAPVTVAGMVTRFRNHQTKKGDAMGFVTLEDLQGNVDLVLFPKTWEKYHMLVQADAVLIAEGKVDGENGDPKVLVDKLSEVPMEVAGVAADDLYSLGGEGDASFGFGDLPNDDADGAVYVSAPQELRQIAEQLQFRSTRSAAQMLSAIPQEDKPAQPPAVDAPEAKQAEPQPVPARQPAKPVERRVVDDAPEEPPDWDQFEPAWMGAPGGEPVAELALPPEMPSQGRRMKESEPSEAVAQPPAPDHTVIEPILEVMPVDQPAPVSGTALPAAPIFLSPVMANAAQESSDPRMLIVALRSTSDRDRDVRRLRMVYGRLRSFPGRDRFAFLIHEGNRQYQLEFPNDSTGISSQLVQKLAELVGEENIYIHPLRIH